MFLRSSAGDAIGDKVARTRVLISWQIRIIKAQNQSFQTEVLQYHAKCFLKVIDSIWWIWPWYLIQTVSYMIMPHFVSATMECTAGKSRILNHEFHWITRNTPLMKPRIRRIRHNLLLSCLPAWICHGGLLPFRPYRYIGQRNLAEKRGTATHQGPPTSKQLRSLMCQQCSCQASVLSKRLQLLQVLLPMYLGSLNFMKKKILPTSGDVFFLIFETLQYIFAVLICFITLIPLFLVASFGIFNLSIEHHLRSWKIWRIISIV